MPRCLLVLAAAAAGAMLVPAAHAGTPEDPEIQGGCADGDSATVSLGGEQVACSAWFGTAGQEQPRLTGTLRVRQDLSQRTKPVRLALTWQREDGCREGWVFSDQLDAQDTLEVERTCPGAPLVSVPLDPARARVTGRDLAVELTGADFSRLGSRLAVGDRLSRPVAYSMVLARSGTARVEFATGIVETEPGRDYTVQS